MTKTNGHDDETTAVQIASETMKGDLRDMLLDRIKALPKPWQQMNESEQRDLAYGVESAVTSAIIKAVQIIAADKRPVIMASLEKVVIKDGIDAQIHLSKNDPQRHELADAVGATLMIAVAHAADYMGEKEPAKTEPDEPTIFDKTGNGQDAAAEARAA